MLVTLGRTGLRVKKLGFGGIPIQRVNESRAVGVVRHAVEKGVDFIDTSRAYTNSEERIGLALNRVKKPVVLASKSVDRTADGIRRDLEISLEKLRKDFIHIYQCHFVHEEDYSGIISPGGALEGLRRAKEQGKIAHTGITSHSLPLLERIVRDGFFDLIMVCFNFMEAEAGERIIPYALSRDIGVIAMKPLAGGVIDRPGPALKYALSREGVLVLCGVEREDLFDENWAVYQGAHELDEEDHRLIREIREAHGKSFCHRCDYCLPCPEGINIQNMLGIRSQVKRMGAGILATPPRIGNIRKARNCSGCGECEERCPYELPIPHLIRENLRYVDHMLESAGSGHGGGSLSSRPPEQPAEGDEDAG